jgi:hypothetical protein
MTLPLTAGGGASELRQTMARILSENGVPAIARPYGHSLVPCGYDVAVEHDGSIVGETQYRGIEWVAVEVKTRILQGVDDYDRVVRRLLDLCRYLGARVNASTGHHLHVEMNEVRHDPMTIRRFYNAAHRFEPVFFGVVAPSRRGNPFCHPLPEQSGLLRRCRTLADFQQVLLLAGLHRHWAVNMTHLFGDAPRIEFRHHHGTLDFEKARHWRNLCLRLVELAALRNCKASKAQVQNDGDGLNRMLVTLGLRANSHVFAKVCPELRQTARFLAARWAHFNSNGGQSRRALAGPSDEDDLPAFEARRPPLR